MKSRRASSKTHKREDSQPVYVYVPLENAPLVMPFQQQIAPADPATDDADADAMLRQIAAAIDFELACLMQGIDPRPRGRG